MALHLTEPQRRFIEAFARFRGFRPYEQQLEAIFHNGSPLWVLAGPGTGKSEVLVLRTLRLMLLDRVDPASIVVTTFTDKASRNLYDRLSAYLEGFRQELHFEGAVPDLSRLWLGTLHSLARKILLEMEDQADDLSVFDEAQSSFVFLRCVPSQLLFDQGDATLSADLLQDLVGGVSFATRIKKAEYLRAAVNRVIEDNVDLAALSACATESQRTAWSRESSRKAFVDLIHKYREALAPSTDFAHLQQRLLTFLQSDDARDFLVGSNTRQLPGVRHVIVDEYQDTNPIQEAIYFELSRQTPSLVVVGDDDQGLYRFRGASVEAMVRFAERAQNELGHQSRTVTLSENRRSHPVIVSRLNEYVAAVKATTSYASARSPKQELHARSSVAGEHVPVSVLVRDHDRTLAQAIARTVHQLLQDGVISDLRQVAVLAPSTKALKPSSGAKRPLYYIAPAFAELGIPLFNPRAKDLHKDELLKAAIGVLLRLLDPRIEYAKYAGKDAVKMSDTCRRSATSSADAAQVVRWADSIGHSLRRLDVLTENEEGRFDAPPYLPHTILDYYYRMLAFQPFSEFIDAQGGVQTALQSWRLGQLSTLLRSFDEAQGQPALPRAKARSRQYFHQRDEQPPQDFGGIDPYYIDRFYRDFLSVFAQGGLEDAEDDFLAFPPGMVPALTIHQAKGLEFSIVFLCGLEAIRGPGAAHIQEDLFGPFRRRVHVETISADERVVHDEIRKVFVAASRPKYALVVCLSDTEFAGITDGTLSNQYPHIPADWLAALPRS